MSATCPWCGGPNSGREWKCRNCGSWFGSVATQVRKRSKQERKWDNYSPEELLSGKDLGIKGVGWGKPKTTKTFTEERRGAGV